MASLTSKIFRTFGSRTAFTWQDGIIPAGGGAVNSVRFSGSRYASFNCSLGEPYAFTITAYKAAATPVVINVSTSAATRATIVAAINAAATAADAYFAGNPVAVDTDNYIALVNAWHIQTGTISDALFALIGLPSIITRDIANTGVTARLCDYNAFGELVSRNDIISDAITIPDGANALTLWPSTTCQTASGAKIGGPDIIVGWGNGVEGEDKSSYVYQPINAVLVAGTPGNSTRADTSCMQLFPILNGVASYPSLVAVQNPPIVLSIPPGATKVRVFNGGLDGTTANIGATPTIPPLFACAVTFGAR